MAREASKGSRTDLVLPGHVFLDSHCSFLLLPMSKSSKLLPKTNGQDMKSVFSLILFIKISEADVRRLLQNTTLHNTQLKKTLTTHWQNLHYSKTTNGSLTQKANSIYFRKNFNVLFWIILWNLNMSLYFLIHFLLNSSLGSLVLGLSLMLKFQENLT